MSQTLLAIDGMAYVFRAYYAVPYTCSRSGVPTNAVQGFQRILLNLLNRLEPDYVAVAFDTSEPTFRHKFYPEYKAQRPPAPEDLIAQIPLVKEYLRAMNVLVVEAPGYEADDVLATMARGAKGRGVKSVIATSDKDLCQMVDEDIFIARVSMNPRDTEILDAGGVFRHYGVRPDQIVDYLTIVGDAADNVRGVDGLGEKSARTLLAEYGTLDGIYDHLDSLPKGQRGKLEGALDHIKDTRFLIQIDSQVPLGCALCDAAVRDQDQEALVRFCQRLDLGGATRRRERQPAPPREQELAFAAPAEEAPQEPPREEETAAPGGEEGTPVQQELF